MTHCFHVLSKKKLLCLAIVLMCLSIETLAQGARLPVEQLDKLTSKASESVDVSLDEQMLQVASRFLRSDKPDEAAIKQLIAGLKGVYVRVLKFDRATDYVASDLDPLRTQLRQGAWSRIVGVLSKRGGENLEVFTWLEGGNINGLAILSVEPTEVVVVNIIGPIDLEKLSQLEGKFGIPELNIDRRQRKE